MPSFVGLELWTETAAGSGARVAFFGPDALTSCVLKTSLAGTEQLGFSLSRLHDSISEIVHGRIARVCWSDTTYDTEWRLSEDASQSGRGDLGQVAWVAQPLYLDLARAPYLAFDSNGRPTYDFSAAQLTATQWLTNYVLPCCTEAPLPYTVAVGTVDYTNVFDMDGEFATALEIIRAIQQPGRAPGDFYFRRNGATDYKIDILAARGSTANTVRVQTARNLLDHARKRTLISLGTKIVPRGKQGAAVRDISQCIWRVQTVVNGTTADLEDPLGGADPIAFDDQLNGMYVAKVASTFSSQVISDSATANSRITVADTTGWASGTTFVRVFRTATSAGNRVVSLTHPTRVVSPASSGYGPVTRILDMPAAVGDTNFVLSNPWMSTWATSTAVADGWTRTTPTGMTWARESTIKKNGTYSQKATVTGVTSYTAQIYSPTATPFTTSGLRFTAHAWVYVESVQEALQRYVRIRVVKATDITVSYADGDYLDPGEIVGNWVKLSVTNVDLSAASAGVAVLVEWYGNNDPNGNTGSVVYIDSVGLGEASVPIDDVLYSGAIPMWQRANTLLGTISTPVAGYTVTLADLERMDTTSWGDEPLVLGGTVEIADTDLSVTTSQRVVELEQDLLNPLAAVVVLQTPDLLLTQVVAGSTGGSTISGSTSTPIITAPALLRTTAREYGITDVYSKAEIEGLLASKANIGTGGQGTGVPLTVGGLTYTALGTYQAIATGGAATTFYIPTAAGGGVTYLELLEVCGYDASSGTDNFVDLLAYSAVGPTLGVIVSTNVSGTPRARTYTLTASSPQVALGGAAGNTYRIVVGVRRAVFA